MPTTDERREVAVRLRHIAEHGAPEWATSACCIAECLGEDDYPLWNGSEKLFARLADLIEPEERTCRPVRKEIEWPTQEGPRNRVVYECSECEAWIGVTSSYCFNCGARIVREDE